MRMKRVLKCMISGIGAGVPRNNCKDAIPQFCVGMTSRGNKNGSEGTDQVWISYEEAFILSKR
jgi:hypothetical protein